MSTADEVIAASENVPRAAAEEAEALAQRGNALQRAARFAEAVTSYDAAIRLDPSYAEAFNNRGVALKNLARLDAALASYDAAIALRPEYASAHYNRGNALQDLERFEEAIASYDRAIVLRPDYSAAHANKGNAQVALGRFAEAVANYDSALALRPAREAEIFSNRGNALKILGRFEESLASYDRAIALRPDDFALHNNRGNALQELDRPEEALASYDAALALKPEYAEAHNNLGLALADVRRFDAALASYAKALEHRPDYAEAVWNRSQAYLMTGRFDLAWRDFEARKRTREPVGHRAYRKPLWLGDSDPAGKTILVHWEQGLGDTIQFCRYVKLLADRGAAVLFAPQAPLRKLMRRLDAEAQIVDADDPGLDFDAQCPLLSLPLAFSTRLSTIPADVPYLAAPAEKISAWRHRLGAAGRPRIGVIWSGGSAYKSNHKRSIGLERFRTLFDDQELRFVSLQKEVSDADRAWLEAGDIVHFGEELEDFTDTAALVHLMDLVISVDTSVAHLAGALGKPTWVLLPFSPDWRWMLDRDDSPWYPSMRLFRQTRRGDWAGVLREVEKELRKGMPFVRSEDCDPAQ
jgi:tetratricopeptide (TPR) repeat protein